MLNLRNRNADGDVDTGPSAGNSGQALLLDMNPHFDSAHFTQGTIDALAAAGIVAGLDGKYSLGADGLGKIINFQTFEPMSNAAWSPQQAAEYATLANEVLLESVGDHYIAGDGRVNENIALTTIHHVFHEEHNFQVRNIQEAIIGQDARAVALGDTSHSVLHDWQVDTGTQDAGGNFTYGVGGADRLGRSQAVRRRQADRGDGVPARRGRPVCAHDHAGHSRVRRLQQRRERHGVARIRAGRIPVRPFDDARDDRLSRS